jgi:hypothetical protein
MYSTYNKIPIYVFQTDHAPESIGFVFPTLGVIYVGDAPMATHNIDMTYLLSHFTSCPTLHPLHMIYDNLYEQERRFPNFPTRDNSCTLIRKLLNVCPNIHFVHHGLMAFVTSSCPITFVVDASLTSEVTLKTVAALNLTCSDSKYRLVGRDFQEDHIVVSSMWFIHKQQDPRKIYRDGHRWRVFCSMHASREEVQEIKKLHPHLRYFPVTGKLVTTTTTRGGRTHV